MADDYYSHERVGQHVTFVDPTGQPHEAIVTADWTPRVSDKPGSLNVVFVVDDAAKSDSYGRQIERATSVPHQDDQSAHGYYWK